MSVDMGLRGRARNVRQILDEMHLLSTTVASKFEEILKQTLRGDRAHKFLQTQEEFARRQIESRVSWCETRLAELRHWDRVLTGSTDYFPPQLYVATPKRRRHNSSSSPRVRQHVRRRR